MPRSSTPVRSSRSSVSVEVRGYPRPRATPRGAPAPPARGAARCRTVLGEKRTGRRPFWRVPCWTWETGRRPSGSCDVARVRRRSPRAGRRLARRDQLQPAGGPAEGDALLRRPGASGGVSDRARGGQPPTGRRTHGGAADTGAVVAGSAPARIAVGYACGLFLLLAAAVVFWHVSWRHSPARDRPARRGAWLPTAAAASTAGLMVALAFAALLAELVVTVGAGWWA